MCMSIDHHKFHVLMAIKINLTLTFNRFRFNSNVCHTNKYQTFWTSQVSPCKCKVCKPLPIDMNKRI